MIEVASCEISGEALLESVLSNPSLTCKAILNETGIVFFPNTIQHNSVQQFGLSYDDNYSGNALAATLSGSRFDIRGHRDFKIERVRAMIEKLSRAPKLSFFRKVTVTYEGKPLRMDLPVAG